MANALKTTLWCLYISVGVLTYVTLFILCIVECYTGRKYKYSTTCDETPGYMFRIKTWLLVDGIVTATSINAILACTACGKIGLVLGMVTTSLFSLFSVAWTIPGFVQLLKYSDSCRVLEHNLWNIAMATIVIRWLFLFITGIFVAAGISHWFNSDD